jgi:hypothetical protein
MIGRTFATRVDVGRKLKDSNHFWISATRLLCVGPSPKALFLLHTSQLVSFENHETSE